MISSQYIARQPDGNLLTLWLNIGVPEFDSESNNGDYRCKIEVQELEFSRYSYGIDTLQALCMTIHCLKTF